MQFKNQRINKEFDLIVPRLRAILFEVDYYTKINFKKEILITGLLRTMQEQQEIYASEIEKGNYIIYRGVKVYSLPRDKEKGRPTLSVHQFGRGADLRDWIFTEEERQEICNYVNKYFPYTNKRHSCILHNVGRGWHFHIQVPFCYCDKDFDFSAYLKIEGANEND